MTGYHHYKLIIDACLNCAALCNHCVSESLKEDPAMMSKCIQLSLECAAVCTATAQLMSLGSDNVKDLARICEKLCDACAEECGQHNSEHCLECAAACKSCADQLEVVGV